MIDAKLNGAFAPASRSPLALVIATLRWPGWARCASSWPEQATGPFTRRLVTGLPLLEAYQQGLETTQEPVLGYCHDDVMVLERGWDRRVLAEFDDPEVGLVGFGGALGHGDLDMYQKPFAVGSLARRGYRSNMRDAEVHGVREAGECDVAVLDGFAMFVRRDVIIRGWPQGTPLGYVGYDYYLSCLTRRCGLRIRMVGVACDHLGGKSTGMGTERWDSERFEEAHRYLWDTCRDVLPWEVTP